MNKKIILRIIIFSMIFYIVNIGLVKAQLCSDLGQTDCLARTDCCWSGHWQICIGTGESCCHDVACSRGDPLCTECPNDALDCYVCQGNNVYKDICAGQTQYELCRGKGSFYDCAYNKYCWGSTLYPLDKRCKCISCIDYIRDLILSPSLPNNVIQQGDGLWGYVVIQATWNCKNTPIVYFEINENGCIIQDNSAVGRYVCSGSWCGYEFSWLFPQIPTSCLGKTVNFKVKVEETTISRSIKLSSDPTRDNLPSLPNVGVWSPSPILPSDLITYTAHAEDDKGLSQIQILFANYKVSTQYGVVKTCPVSGTSADCTYTTPTSYSAGSEICMIGNALDTKSQQNTGYDMGARKDRNCKTVCNFPIDTDNDKNYYTQGNCTGPCGRPQTDFCPWEGPKGYCCNSLGENWYANYTSQDGTVICCRKDSPLPISPCLETKTINCKNILGEYFVNGRDCGLEFYDCSGEGKICQSGICVSGSSTCTHANPTVTISPSSQTSSPGQSLTYTASIKNNDNSVCSASTFILTNTCPSGWTCSLNKNSVAISPGSTDSSTTITVTSSSSATSGTYSFSVTATSSSYTGTGSANYVIGGTTNQCSDGTTYGQCSSNKPKYCDNGNLVDKCSSKSCGCPIGQTCNTTSDTCYTPSGNIQINLKPGWNMFSVPVNTSLNVNDIKTQCGTTNPVWHYNPSSSLYESVTQVQPGYGYWLKVSNNCYIQVSGNNIESLPELKAGWNQVGALSQSVNFNDVKGNCNVLGGPWKYNPVTLRYELASTLDPSYGYWVRVSNNCNLNAGGSPPPTP